MTLQDLTWISRHGRRRLALAVFVAIAVVVWAAAHFLEPAPPRRIVLASGLEDGLAHEHAQRYVAVLARAGVKVEERITRGSKENLELLRDPHSGVDVAFVQGGIETAPETDNVVMIASLYNLPVWVFYRDTEQIGKFSDLRGHRVAVGTEASGAHAIAEDLFRLNRLSSANVTMVPLANSAALLALKSGEVDAAIFVDGDKSQSVAYALAEPNLRLFAFARAEAYTRLLPYVTKLTLPAGAIDLPREIPKQDVELIATKQMLATRDSLHPALVGLLIDAAREIHGDQGVFRRSGEFPQTTRVDLPVSPHATQHHQFGAHFLYRYLPFWVATLVERAILILLPIAAVVYPVVHFLPQLLRWRWRSRIYRWYADLAVLERDIATRSGALPAAEWLADLDRIENAVARIDTPAGFASEAYTLRQHIEFVRDTMKARMSSVSLP